MTAMRKPGTRKKEHLKAICAVLGIDIVAFSKLVNDDQISAVRYLLKWVRAAVDYYDIPAEHRHWSPAGDGGFITFKTPASSEKAIDVAFSIFERAQRPPWVPRTGRPLEFRFGLHAGHIEEGEEFGGGTNVWGDGINMAARVLSVCANSQILVSTQYYDTYVHPRQGYDFQFDDAFQRTVKHGVHVTVRNARRGLHGLGRAEELARRWAQIGEIWKSAVDSYTFLIDDALMSANPIASLAAAKFLLELKNDSKVAEQKIGEVFASIGDAAGRAASSTLRHPIFNAMPPNLLKQLVREAAPRLFPRTRSSARRATRPTVATSWSTGTSLSRDRPSRIRSRSRKGR